MIPNRVFVATLGVALIALAIVQGIETGAHFGVVISAIGGLFLVNASLRRHRGRSACAQRRQVKGGASVA